MKRFLFAALILGFVIPYVHAQKPQTGIIVDGSPGSESGGRHGEYSKWFAGGPHYKTVSATYFGGKDMEEFIAAGALSDKRIVAIGNAWGPSFSASPKPIVLGRGQHHGQKVPLDKRGAPARGAKYQSGFFVIYSKDLKKIEKVIRLDWGVANISAANITADGKGIIIAGQCGDKFASLNGKLGKVKKLPYVEPPKKPSSDSKKKKKRKSKPAVPKDVFISRISPEGKIVWTVILEKATIAPARIFTDQKNNLWFDSNGFY